MRMLVTIDCRITRLLSCCIKHKDGTLIFQLFYMDLKLGLSLNMRHNLQWQLITGTSCGPQVVRETSVVLAVVQRGSSSGFVRAFKAFSLCSGKRKNIKNGVEDSVAANY